MNLYDLHTHTTFSDGVLIPAESARRARADGYKGIVFTDHADISNYLHILENQLRFKEQFNAESSTFKVLVGVELTHVRPSQIGMLTEKARAAGADLVVVHGETITEPVEEGTNAAACEAGVDILAHPGLISDEDVKKGVANGVYFELSTRKGHSITNGHVAKKVIEFGGQLVVNNDYHAPGDRASADLIYKILAGAGLGFDDIDIVFDNNEKIFKSILEG